MENEKAEITLEDLKRGSDNVLRHVYEDNRDKFLNYAKRYHLSEAENIDVYQDAYVIFYENIMSGKVMDFTSSISTYLFGIGKYLIFDRMRKNKKTIRGEFDFSMVGENDRVIDEIEIEKKELTVEQQLLQQYFRVLGQKCQDLLTLFYYRGFSIQEIMQAGGYNSENVVKSQKSRCLKTLKERIKESR